MKNAALGQYYPSDSVIHRLDGRIKIILAVLFIVICFLCKSIPAFLMLILSTFVLIFISRIHFSVIFKALKAIIVILAFTFILNMFFTAGEKPIFSWWIFTLYPEGIRNAALMGIRILALIISTSVFVSYTTTPIQLTDSLESLLSPLKLLKVPVSDFAMMMSIALRFIPTLSEETEKIMTAQRSRGADFNTGSLVKRIKSLVPVLVPLFVSAFRRADDLATAMECRCYNGGKGRTKMNVPELHPADFVALAAVLLLGAGVIFINRLDFTLL